MSRALRVLLVEDSEDDALLLASDLHDAGFDLYVERVETPDGLTAALGRGPWDVVVSDFTMPRFDAFAALRLVQEHAVDLPFIIVSGTVGEDVAVAAMKAGAHDYIMKGNTARLIPAIEREVREAEERRRRRLEEEEKRRIQAAFDLYLHPKLARMLSDNPRLLRLGGEKREMTVLFADLRGFTSLAEMVEPDALVEVLNEYLDAMTEVVFAYDGLLDKYVGDGLMALWGPPFSDERHAARACWAALEMDVRLRALHVRWRDRGLPPLEMGVGISTGPMVVGNMGSRRRFTYTAVGDNVNLGARLEALNKLYGTRILLSERTQAALDSSFLLRETDTVRVKGRRQPVVVYELIGSREGAAMSEPFLADFAAALEAYRARRWDAALHRFTTLAAQYPSDGPTRLYAERCRVLSEVPPSADWDGVFEAGLEPEVLAARL